MKMNNSTKRLDFLLYSHDGKGLGHSSRTVAIGLALQRLSPDSRILLVNGAIEFTYLIGNNDIDWIKLPSYKSNLLNDINAGVSVASNFSSEEISSLRRSLLEDIIKQCRPHCVLVDHLPEGKKSELTDALKISKDMDTRWVLGLRAVIGEVSELWSKKSYDTFKDYYEDILWYGDRKIHTNENFERINDHFGKPPHEMGYVSRAVEVCGWPNFSGLRSKKTDGTIGISWCTHSTEKMLSCISRAVHEMNRVDQVWRSYVGQSRVDMEREKIIEPLLRSRFFDVNDFSDEYLWTLRQSKLAIVYGGYNSITDILWAKIPSIIIIRQSRDSEQAIHAHLIKSRFSKSIHVFNESELSKNDISNSIKKLAEAPALKVKPSSLKGAEKSAQYLLSTLEKIKNRSKKNFYLYPQPAAKSIYP